MSVQGVDSLSWLGVGPLTGGVAEVYGEPLAVVTQSPWLTKSEKERIEDLLLSGSLAIPPPQINIADFRDISLRFPEHFSLTALAGAAVGLGATEGAAILAALAVWGQGLSEEELEAARTSNPLEAALNTYIKESPTRAAHALSLLAVLRRQSQLQAAMKSISSDTIDKAVKIAEQQLIIAFLLNWSAMEAKLSQQAREESVKRQLIENEYMRQVVAEYVRKAEITQAAMKEPSLSILVGGLATDARTTEIINSVVPFGRVEGGLFTLPASVAAELNTIAGAVTTAATMWSAPVALSLVSYAPGLSQAQLRRDSSEAFAITLGTMMTSQDFDPFISSMLNQAVTLGQITKEQATTALAALKASLLLMSMASLYKAQYGGVTGGELRAIVIGEMKLGETDFCGVLAKLVQEQLLQLPPESREEALRELISPFDEGAVFDGAVQPLTDFLTGWDPSSFRDTPLASPG